MEKSAERVLRFLGDGPATVADAVEAGRVALGSPGGTISVAVDLLRRMAVNGLIVRNGGTIRLGEAGRAAAKGRDDVADVLSAAPRDLDLAMARGASADAPALVNHAESPLGSLMRRKAKDGSSFLSPEEFEAGERFRADYTRGALMPRLGANWIAPVASGRRSAGGSAVDLTDAALGARERVEEALEAVGPELAGVLIDVCCFLKGLSQVEHERGWPARSAKIVLKAALGALDRHYRPRSGGRRKGGRVLHWGAGDYRPEIT